MSAGAAIDRLLALDAAARTRLLQSLPPGVMAMGDRFALIEASAATGIDLPAGRIGGAVRVMAIGVGESLDPVTTDLALTGASTCPPSPVWLRAERVAGGLRLSWVRRSRAGWRWIDGTDAPLVEESERYRVTVGGVDRLVTSPELLLTDADAPPGTIVCVRQQGTNGESPPATITLPPA